MIQNRLSLIVIIFLGTVFFVTLPVHNYFALRQPKFSAKEFDSTKGGKYTPDYLHLLALFVGLFITFLFEAFSKVHQIPVPTGGVIAILSVVWGMYAFYDFGSRDSALVHMQSKHLLIFFLAAHIFYMSVHTDVSVFIKTLPQILIIGIPVYFLTAILFGILSIYIIDPAWSILDGISFGIYCSPTFPYKITKLLKQHSINTKQIAIILEGEALMSLTLSSLLFSFKLGEASGFLKKWYDYVPCLFGFTVGSLFIGIIMGLIALWILTQLASNRVSYFMFTFGVVFFMASVLFELPYHNCAMTVMIFGIMYSRKRNILPKDVRKYVYHFWYTASLVAEALTCMKGGTKVAIYFIQSIDRSMYPTLLVLFAAYHAIRFGCYLLFAPLLSRLGYGMDIRNMCVCVTAGVKTPISVLTLIRVVILQVHSTSAAYEDEFARTSYFYVMGLYILSALLNGYCTQLLLEFLGLTNISLARQINMGLCLKHIFSKRDRTVQVLKMDKYLADTNWGEVVTATSIQHPYHTGKVADEGDDQDGVMVGYRFTWCPDCQRDVPQEPSPKELKEMRREAKLRMLKARKMCYSRKYESGLISQRAVMTLNQAVQLAIDSKETEIKVEDLHTRFMKQSWFAHHFRKSAEKITRQHEENLKKFKAPNFYWRRLCFHLTLRDSVFNKFVQTVVVIDSVMIVFDLLTRPSFMADGKTIKHFSKSFEIMFIILRTLFAIIYFTEYVMRVLALSWKRIFCQGFCLYFWSFFRTVDFIVMIGCAIDGVYLIYCKANGITITKKKFDDSIFLQILCGLLLCRWIRLLQILIVCRHYYIKFMDSISDRNLEFTYELGKSYISAEKEMLEVLSYMIHHKGIREELRTKMEDDVYLINQVLDTVHKDRQWVSITVKTKQAIRTILNSMREAITELKTSGWVDTYEFELLTLGMDELATKVNAIKKVLPSAPKVIFKEVAWMEGDEQIIDFLFENVTVNKYNPGDIVFQEGEVADGIYIVVTGLFNISYKPNSNILDSLKEYGQLPIVDYVAAGKNYHEPFEELIVSGNCIGELSVLTSRAYNSVITADNYGQVYVLSNGVLKRAMELSPDPVVGIQAKLWKAIGIRVALPILLTIPAFEGSSVDQIKLSLERAFVPNLKPYKIFVVNEVIEDIVLIEGVVVDFNTREPFIAPCYIPRTVNRLILPGSSLMNIDLHLETRLLIIPVKDSDGYDVLVAAEETCEMSNAHSSLCLQHAVQERLKKRKKKRMKNASSNIYSADSSSQPDMVSTPSGLYGYTGSMYYNKYIGDQISVHIPVDDEK